MEWKSSVRILDKDNGNVIKEFESITALIEYIKDKGYSNGASKTIKGTILSVLNGRPKRDGKGSYYVPKTAYGFSMEYINKATTEVNKEIEFIKSKGLMKEYQNFLNEKEK